MRVTSVWSSQGWAHLFGDPRRRQSSKEIAAAREHGSSSATSQPAIVDGTAPDHWHLRVDIPGHPDIRGGTRTLQAGETWDVGTLQITIGGTLVLQKPADPERLDCRILTPDGGFVAGLYSPAPPLRSALLAPGDYVVLVQSKGLAAQAMPFAIRSAEETTLTLVMTAGVRQDLVFVKGSAAAHLDSLGFELRSAGKLMLLGFPRGGTQQSREHTLWLAPGDYELRTRDREPATTEHFTVGAEAGQPVRIAVR